MANKHAVHFSSKKQDWATPPDFFELYNKIYKFKLDLACTQENCLCPEGYYLEHYNSLEEEWHQDLEGKWGWLNPPYGRELKHWIKKTADEAELGAKIVLLIPARTDTAYFHDYIYKNPRADVSFIRGRLKFGDSKNSAPFPSMIVVFNGGEEL